MTAGNDVVFEGGLIADEDIESLNMFGHASIEAADDARVVGDYMADVGDDYHENTVVAIQGITAGGSDSKPLKKHAFEASMGDTTPYTKAAAFILFHNHGKFLVALRAPGGDCGETWGNIGGGQEAEDIISGDPYTSFIRTATREVAEEIGMMPAGAKIRGHYTHEGEGFRAVNFIVDVDDQTADNWKFNLQEEELTEIKWATMDELKSQARDLHPAFRHMLFRFYDNDGNVVQDPNWDGPEGTLRHKPAPSRKAKAPDISTGRLSTGEPNALYGRGLFQVEAMLGEDGPYNMVGNPSTDNYMKDLFTPDTIIWYDGDGVNIPSSIFAEGRIMADLFTALLEDWSPDVPDAELNTKATTKAKMNDKSAIDYEHTEDVERYGEDYVSDSNSSDMHSPWASMVELYDDANEQPGAKKAKKAKPDSPKNADGKRMITFEGAEKVDRSWLDEFSLAEWYRISEADGEPEGDDDELATAVEINLDNEADENDGTAVNYEDVKEPSDDIKRIQDRDKQEPEEKEEDPDDEGDNLDIGEEGEVDEETLKRIQGKLAAFISRSLQSENPVKIFMSGTAVVLQFNRLSNKQTVQLVINSPTSVALNVGRKTDDEAIVGTAISSVNL